jgi:hypothetical protein
MPPAAMGGMLVRPMRTAPASFNLVAMKASSFGMRFLKAGEPAPTVMPRYLNPSFSM